MYSFIPYKLLIYCCLRVFYRLQPRGDQQDLRPVLGRGVPRCGQQLRRGRGGRPRAPVEQRQPANFDELRISTMTRTMTCRSGGFALAVAPPPAMAVAPLRKFIVNVSVRLLRPSIRQHSLRTSRTPTYETYDHPYVKLDVVRVVRRTTSRCFAYGPS